MSELEIQNYIKSLIERAKKAQAVAEGFTQEDVRHYAACIGWLALNKAEEWAKFNYSETKMGDIQSKINRTSTRARGLTNDLKKRKQSVLLKLMRKSSSSRSESQSAS